MLADHDRVQGAIQISNLNRILLVQGKITEKWSFPKGHPNQGETGFQCAKREVFEETGLHLPLFFDRIVRLATGSQFVVQTQEKECKAQNPDEIISIGWFTLEEIHEMNVNLDVNIFLRNQSNLVPNSRPIQRNPSSYMSRTKQQCPPSYPYPSPRVLPMDL